MLGRPRRLWRRFVGQYVGRISSFVTVPGVLTLGGIVAAFLTIWLDGLLSRYGITAPMAHFSPEAARTILSTLSGVAMSALSLVYSTVLLVFTLAAGTIAPRLLERFSEDRMSHIAVGSLGALFLHSLISLAAVDEQAMLFPVLWAILTACVSVITLLIFVHGVSRRVTIDEEIANISNDLDKQLSIAAVRSNNLSIADLVRPEGRDAPVRATSSGYINKVDFVALADAAAAHNGYVDFTRTVGDHVLKGDAIAVVVGTNPKALATEAEKLLVIAARRTPEEDVRFSADLLLEIALRALSPGVNDSFTAIACIDRYVASMASAAEAGLHSGVFCDEAGVARISAPRSEIADLIKLMFEPIRQASRGNLLMAEAIISALTRLKPRLNGAALAETERQITLTVKEVEAGAPVREDQENLGTDA